MDSSATVPLDGFSRALRLVGGEGALHHHQPTCVSGACSSSFHQSRSNFCCWNSSSQLTTCTTMQPPASASGAAAYRVGGRSLGGHRIPGLPEAHGVGGQSLTRPGGPSPGPWRTASCSSASAQSRSSVTAENTVEASQERRVPTFCPALRGSSSYPDTCPGWGRSQLRVPVLASLPSGTLCPGRQGAGLPRPGQG